MCHFKESDETNLANFSICTSIDMAFVNFSKNVLYALFGSSKIVKHTLTVYLNMTYIT